MIGFGKLRDFWAKAKGGFVKVGASVSTEKYYAKLGWWIFSILAGLGITFLVASLLLGGARRFALLFIIAAGYYFWEMFQEIKYPNLGLLYVKGELVDILRPGWQMSVPYLYRIELQERVKIRVDIDHNMQVPNGKKDVTEAKIKFVMDVILGSGIEEIKKAKLLERLDKEYLDDFFQEILASEARTLVGGVEDFNALLKEQATLQEKMILDLTKKITEKHGFLVELAEISSIEETAHTEAGRRKVLAEAMGTEARLVVEPLKEIKDNWQAATVMAAQSVFQPRPSSRSEKSEGDKKNKTDEGLAGSAISAVEGAVSAVKKMVKGDE